MKYFKIRHGYRKIIKTILKSSHPRLSEMCCHDIQYIANKQMQMIGFSTELKNGLYADEYHIKKKVGLKHSWIEVDRYSLDYHNRLETPKKTKHRIIRVLNANVHGDKFIGYDIDFKLYKNLDSVMESIFPEKHL